MGEIIVWGNQLNERSSIVYQGIWCDDYGVRTFEGNLCRQHSYLSIIRLFNLRIVRNSTQQNINMEGIVKLRIKIYSHRLWLDLTRLYQATNQIVAVVCYERWRNIHVLFLFYQIESSKHRKSTIQKLTIQQERRLVVGWKGGSRRSWRLP